MKLVRHGAPGVERAGALDGQGRVRDLSLLVPDLTPEWLSPERLGAIAAIDLQRIPIVPVGAPLGAPVAGTRQFIAIGLNYRLHAIESNLDIPSEPVVFSKAITSIAGPDDDLLMPPDSVALDWEVELAVVIGTTARKLGASEALAHVAGYCLANDVSERDWQLRRNGQWVKGKSHDGFGPLGPWLVTTDEVPDPQEIDLELRVNGELRQRSNTNDMIFPVAQIVAYLSQFMTLLPGDVVITGTPHGVGMGMQPPHYLARGDVITLNSPQLGSQRQSVR
jgi:2,4-didehydro-3-deoxy-L-rhamnonate hydrolase